MPTGNDEVGQPVTRIGLLSNPTRPDPPTLIEWIREWANQNGVELCFSEDLAAKIGDCEGLSPAAMAERVDVIVVLGGDGSILRAVRQFARFRMPVAGINLGHLGFLTVGGRANTFRILDRLRTGQYDLELRMMLQTRVFRQSAEVFRGIALNDVVILKQPVSRVVEVAVSVFGTPMSTFVGDGVVFASPTGSTAYSLSVGGPIVPPWVQVMIIAPISSHTLAVRPVVVSDRALIEAHLGSSQALVNLVLDGQEGHLLQPGDRIEIRRAEESARIVVGRHRNFFAVLRRKMGWGT